MLAANPPPMIRTSQSIFFCISLTSSFYLRFLVWQENNLYGIFRTDQLAQEAVHAVSVPEREDLIPFVCKSEYVSATVIHAYAATVTLAGINFYRHFTISPPRLIKLGTLKTAGY
jgi:hypothetical protein